MARRGLQALLIVLGLVAIVAGAVTMIGGAATVLGVDHSPASLDSELRFYATWYALAGIVMLRSTRRVESAGAVIRLVAAGFFIAGCTRILSWAAVGRPDAFFVALMIVELSLPAILIPWHAAVARQIKA